MHLHGELWLSSPKLRQELAEAIKECAIREDPQVVALSWLAMLLLGDTIQDFAGHAALWKELERANKWCVEAWLELLDLYYLPAVFDEPDDAEQLGKLHGRWGGKADAKMLDALAEIGTPLRPLVS